MHGGVSFLERVVARGFADLSQVELIFLGLVLFTIHTRSRFGDAAKVCIEPALDLDPQGGGFIETAAVDHKTAGRPRRARRALPMVGHARGLSQEPWAAAWLERRRECGLHAGRDGALMPEPLADGGFGRSRLPTGHAGRWLSAIGARVPELAEFLGPHRPKRKGHAPLLGGKGGVVPGRSSPSGGPRAPGGRQHA